MEVILDTNQKPTGVFLSLSEWEQVKPGVNSSSSLYKLMDELSHRDVFDMNSQELADHLQPVIEQTVKQALDNGLYFSYPADPDGFPGAFIHEYKNGKKVLIEIDTQTGREHFIKNL